MKKLSIVPAVALSLALTAGPAAAKGPIVMEASITGPGLDAPIEFSGYNTPPGSPAFKKAERLALFAEQTGLQGRILFGDDQGVEARAPSGKLGPRFRVVWTVGFGGIPGTGQAKLTSDLYPYAEGGPVLYTPEKKLDFGEEGNVGGMFHVDAGWQHASPVLLENLQGWGFPSLEEVSPPAPARDVARDSAPPAPATEPAAASDPAPWLLVAVIAAALGAAAIAGLALKRDPAL